MVWETVVSFDLTLNVIDDPISIRYMIFKRIVKKSFIVYSSLALLVVLFNAGRPFAQLPKTSDPRENAERIIRYESFTSLSRFSEDVLVLRFKRGKLK